MDATTGEGPTGEVRPEVPVAVRSRAHEVFVGRDAELRRLLDLVQRDRCRAALVTGEAGVGKSRLVAEVLARLPSTSVLRGGTDPLDEHRPFAAVLAALGPLDHDRSPAEADLVAVLEACDDPDTPSGTLGAGPALRSRLVDALVATIAARAADGRVAVVLEDLHRSDAGTIAVVAELADPTPGRDVVVLGTLRGAPWSDGARQLDRLVDRGLVAVLELPPLSDAEVLDLAHGLLGRRPSPALLDLLAGAGGNPFYAAELASALAEQGSLVTTTGPDAEVGVRHASAPPDLQVTVLRRLSELPGATMQVLRFAALLGTTFAVDDLAVVVEVPIPTVIDRLDEARRAGWVQPAGDRLAFRHDLVREAIHDDLPLAVRRSLHRHCAHLLTAAGADPADIARHLVLGASPPDPDAAAWLHAAGRRASSRDPRAAVPLLAAALELVPDPGPTRDRVQLDLGTARCWAGDVATGEAELRELLSRPHAARTDTDATLALARSRILSGDTAEALAVLDAGLTRAADDRDRARLLAERAVGAMLRGEVATAREAAADVLAVGAADDESTCVALSVRCALSALEGRFVDAIAAGESAVDVASGSADRETVRRPPQLFLGSVLLDADRFDEGFRLLDAGRRASETLGAVWDLPLVHLVTARGRYLTGELDDCSAEAETALTLADEVGTRVLEVWGHALVAHVHLHRGHAAAAEAAIAAGEAVVTRVGPQIRGADWLVWARARLALHAGDREGARQLLTLVWDGHRERGMRSERRLFGPQLVALHRDAGEREAAADVVESIEELAGLAGTGSAEAAALHARGLLLRDPVRLVAAASTTASGPCRTEHVAQAVDAAEQFGALGRAEEATRWYERALDVARAAGMSQSVRRAEAGLRGFGVRVGVRGQRARPPTGWDALTPTERTVADLAAQGLSNPEIGDRLFISRRTVQTHLSHVYGKLAISSRVELAGRLARRQQTVRAGLPGAPAR